VDSSGVLVCCIVMGHGRRLSRTTMPWSPNTSGMEDYTLLRNQDQTDTMAEAMQASSEVVARFRFMRVEVRENW
jgi:hypothetical protein